MRELKFRAFIKEYGTMHNVKIINIYDGLATVDRAYGETEFMFDEIELMKSTGLVDKNKKEIYEGDIVICDDCMGRIGWNEDDASFYFYVLYEGGSFDEEKLYDYVDDMEVIGNMLENPDMIDLD